MEWLTPLTGLYAAAVAVPVLLLLYFLKLKRQEHIVSSTFLWKRAVQDLQVNAPFQRLRRNLLLLLQLLMLAAILAALGGPLLSMKPGEARRYVLLIDRSASMGAADVDPTRLQEAGRQAKVFVESLRGGGMLSLGQGSDQAMVVAFDDHADVMCSFTSDKRQLTLAIDAIEQSDGRSLLGEALTVAQAFAQSPGVEGNIRTAESPAKLVLFSDGRIADLDEIVISADEVEYHSIGQSPDNIAITAMQARRSYEDPQEVAIFASLVNYTAEQTSCDVQLSIDDNVKAVRSLTIAAAGDTPGSAVVSFTIRHGDAAVVEVRQLRADALAADDAAWAILPAPRRLSVLLVTQGNPALQSALAACPLDRLDPCTPAGFEAMDQGVLDVRQPYDVIVMDNYAPAKLPRGRYLLFGAVPNDIGISITGRLDNELIADWRNQHPVLKYVNLGNLFAAGAHQMTLPRDGEVLAEFASGPAIALVRRPGGTFLLTAFDCLETNWPFEPSFVLFCYNSLMFLGSQSVSHLDTHLAVGQPIQIEGLPAGTAARLSGPGIDALAIEANPSGVLRYAATGRAGVYRLTWGSDIQRLFAVNLLDDQESRIEPVREITAKGQTITAQPNVVTRANIELWPWLVAAALMLACVEWLVYNRKMRI